MDGLLCMTDTGALLKLLQHNLLDVTPVAGRSDGVQIVTYKVRCPSKDDATARRPVFVVFGFVLALLFHHVLRQWRCIGRSCWQ